MEAFQHGDQEAFTQLYERHLQGLLNFFFRLSWDHALAEDLTQEVLLRIFRHAQNWTPQAKFKTFLYRVAKNLWIDHLRSAHTRKSKTSLYNSDPDQEGRHYIDMLPSELKPVGRNLEYQERYSQIMQALDQLPDEQRMVFVLAEVEHMGYQEISDVMEIPLGTVKSRMHIAVKKLRELLKDLLIEPA